MARTSSRATRFDTYESGVPVLVRTGRHGRDAVEWSQPFVSSLHLQRNAQGHTVSLTLADRDFAEFDPRHHEEADGVLNAEDYLLEVLEFRA